LQQRCGLCEVRCRILRSPSRRRDEARTHVTLVVVGGCNRRDLGRSMVMHGCVGTMECSLLNPRQGDRMKLAHGRFKTIGGRQL
jgi:hypothetical protein